jgi:hypothetical protein
MQPTALFFAKEEKWLRVTRDIREDNFIPHKEVADVHPLLKILGYKCYLRISLTQWQAATVV